MMRFGQVEYDVARGRLSVAGKAIELDRPCRAILSLLLQSPGQDVDKDRLLEVGWPGRVVHENSLAKAIGRLRQALGEDGDALETVHGYGYRLAAPVETQAPPEPQRARRNVLRPALAIAALALFALVAPWPQLLSGEAQGSEERGLIRGEPADAIGRVLWVDDHPENNMAERRHLERRKVAVYQVTTSEEALALLAMYHYDAVVSDMNRHDRPLAGLEFVREMRRRADRTPVYFYTIVPSDAQKALVRSAGGQGAATTPEDLYAAVLPLMRRQRTAMKD